MKRAFKLEGLNCANCAEKMEREIKALKGVNFASVNFMTAKMIIDGDERDGFLHFVAVGNGISNCRFMP